MIKEVKYSVLGIYQNPEDSNVCRSIFICAINATHLGSYLLSKRIFYVHPIPSGF